MYSSYSRNVVLFGATLTGNRGAESMLRAVLQRLPHYASDLRFSLLSLYPDEDERENDCPNLNIVACPPWYLVTIALPMAIVVWMGRLLRVPWRRVPLPAALRTLLDAHLMIDLSGISFADGRRLMLVYNAIAILLPVLTGTRVMKYSQAMGPFQETLNRTLARWLLPRVETIAARGELTARHLAELGIHKARVVVCADAAFAMQVGKTARARAGELIPTEYCDRQIVCVAPSSQVESLCRRQGIDYAVEISQFIGDTLISARQYGVLLIAHSARPGKRSQKNNDLIVCRRIADLVAVPERCQFLDAALPAEVLRALIGESRYLVTSRFHAMVSGLSMGVPTALIGWSHKYAEVLNDFQLQRFAIDYRRTSGPAITDLFSLLEQEESIVRRRIADGLPRTLESSLCNARLAADLLGNAKHLEQVD